MEVCCCMQLVRYLTVHYSVCLAGTDKNDQVKMENSCQMECQVVPGTVEADDWDAAMLLNLQGHNRFLFCSAAVHRNSCAKFTAWLFWCRECLLRKSANSLEHCWALLDTNQLVPLLCIHQFLL